MPETIFVRTMAFDQMLPDTAEVVAEMDLEELQAPRQHNHNSDYYHLLYFLLFDIAVQQLQEHFYGNSSLHKYQVLENALLIEKRGDIVTDLSVYDENDWADLQIQLLFRRKRSVKNLSDTVSILKGMAPE